MSTIQNLKNLIRIGGNKNAAHRQAQAAEPTANVSPVNAHNQAHGNSHHFKASGNQKSGSQKRARDREIQRLVAEERREHSTMPRYPGLTRWELIEKMGDGAFSNVYRARDTEGDRGEVAIKVVRKYEMNSKQRANILKEVQIMRQLDHPNIARLIDFSEAPQFYYIVLELCPGGELFHQIVKLTYFSENLSRHVIIQVANAIHYLHEKSGVVHRDIKPENLLFFRIPITPSKHPKPPQPGDEDKVDEGEFVPGVGGGGIGMVKVADFGLSKVIWDNETMTPCGTVGYTAPEIVKDERYSKSVDMWALGCVLYTLLCGFPPFYDESIQALTEKVAHGQYTFLSPWWDDVSKPAKDLVSHLLTVDPEKRYTIHQFLDHPWIKQSDEETTAAADAPPLATPAMNLTPPVERHSDFRSPGAMNLREVFDVSYAVHRQEEEEKRRRQLRSAINNPNSGTAGFRAALDPLNEDDDDEDGWYERVPAAEADAALANQLRTTSLSQSGPAPVGKVPAPSGTTATYKISSAAQARNQPYQFTKTANAYHPPRARQSASYGSHSPAVAAVGRENAARSSRQPFDLKLDNATLLGRRGRNKAAAATAATTGAGGGPGAGNSPLAASTSSPINAGGVI